MHKYRYLLIAFDVVANTISEQYNEPVLVRLYVYLIQDLSLLFSLLIILLQFFREEILRARIFGRVMLENWPLLLASLFYIALTVSWQAGMHWKETYQWTRLAHALTHRLVAVIYYFALARPIQLTDELVANSKSHIDTNKS